MTQKKALVFSLGALPEEPPLYPGAHQSQPAAPSPPYHKSLGLIRPSSCAAYGPGKEAALELQLGVSFSICT
jgi:hypothetical protein